MMKDMMKKMMLEDNGSSGDMEKEAKLKVLKELRKMASDMMGGDLKDGMMKKVSVAAPDKEGLKVGLEKAQDMLDKNPMDPMSEESSENEMEDMEECSPEEIDAKIAELQKMKQKMQMK